MRTIKGMCKIFAIIILVALGVAVFYLLTSPRKTRILSTQERIIYIEHTPKQTQETSPALNVSLVPHTAQQESVSRYESFNTILGERADENNVIVLSYVEFGYIDLAVNFYISSIAHFNTTNYLMISSDEKSCECLTPMNIKCVYLMKNIKGTGKASKYGTEDFKAKTFAKTQIVFAALKFGFTVILTDLDIFYLKNPIPLILKESQAFDLTIQKNDEREQANSGFYVARPTPETLSLFAKICEREAKSFKLSEQTIMIDLLKSLKKAHSLKVKYLDSARYPAGSVFWEKQKRMFEFKDPHLPTAGHNEVIAHNNWVVGKWAKIYRFKESLMWRYDKDGYYSNMSAKYIEFETPYDGDGKMVTALEKSALLSALSIGYILNRIVILPSFHCYGCNTKVCFNSEEQCSLQAHYRIAQFDKYFDYREHVFLSNPATPNKIKKSTSTSFLIQSNFTTEAIKKDTMSTAKDVETFHPSDTANGASVDEIIEWFGHIQDSILRFHSLYDAFKGFPNDPKYAEIKKKINSALVKATYRQYG